MTKPKAKGKTTDPPRVSPAFAEIELAKIESNPWQPRTTAPTDVELSDLMNSIKAVGQRVPILVRPNPTKAGRFQLGDGAMRKMIAAKLGKKTIIAMVQELTDRQMKILAIAANTFVRLRDEDKEAAVYHLWESEFKTDEPSKHARKDAVYTGIREMERETGISDTDIARYLRAHEARSEIVREAPKDVKASIKEVSTKDMATIAEVARESPKLALQIVAARDDDEIYSTDVQEIAKGFKQATPTERVKITEQVIAAKREEKKAIDELKKASQEVKKATSERVAEIVNKEGASPEERTKRAEKAATDQEEERRKAEEETLRQVAINREKLDGQQLTDFMNIEMAAKSWMARAEANANDEIKRRILNVRNQNVKRETIAKVKSIAAIASEASKRWSDFAAGFKEE